MSTASCFNDPSCQPTRESINEALGAGLGGTWIELFDRLGSHHPDVAFSWTYYADSARWLMKAFRKNKTAFWVSVERGVIKTTFYFPNRLRREVLASEVSESTRATVRESKPIGKLCAVVLESSGESGLAKDVMIDDVLALVSLKRSLKLL